MKQILVDLTNVGKVAETGMHVVEAAVFQSHVSDYSCYLVPRISNPQLTWIIPLAVRFKVEMDEVIMEK